MATSYLLGAATVQGAEVLCSGPHQDVSPALTDLGQQAYIRMNGEVTGFYGGLYPGGLNTAPRAHQSAGLVLANRVGPLDAEGNPDHSAGRIVLLSVGMSNTAQEFEEFRERVLADSAVNPQLVLVNGAASGKSASYWVEPDAAIWQEVNRRLAVAGVTPAQVQVAWVKLARVGGGDFPEKAQRLQADLEAVARNLLYHYPNLKLTYFSSRTRSYNYSFDQREYQSPEPAAFESGFAVKWLIEQQLQGEPDLNYDPDRGPVVAPWLAWGPYLWIDGLNPRSDGRVWSQSNLAPDCTHPSPTGQGAVAQMLLEFFKSAPSTQRWFLAQSLPSAAPTLENHDPVDYEACAFWKSQRICYR